MIGLDTSVLVQREVRDAPKHHEAGLLPQREAFDRNETIAITPQVILESCTPSPIRGGSQNH